MERILVPIDGSKYSYKALSFAIDLAKKFGSKIFLLYVKPDRRVPEDIKEFMKAEEIKDMPPDQLYLEKVCDGIVMEANRMLSDLPKNKVKTVCEEGHPSEKILELAKKEKIDTIIMGSRGLGGFRGLLMGSVSQNVCHNAPCSCIIVR